MGRKRSDLAAIRSQFPSVDTLDWKKAFTADIDLFGRMWKDILKFDQAGEGRPGPRPALDPSTAYLRFRQLSEGEYSMLPFREAVRLLAPRTSIRRIAEKTGLDRNLVHRLMKGQVEPDNYEMELFAAAFGRRPSYFLEYRIGFILMLVHEHMMQYPESSVGPYVKVRDALGKKD